jgi:opacity protein-like surface antigen
MRTSKLFAVLAIIFLATGLSQAQVYLGVQGGVGFSSFEEQDKGASAIPLGITVGTDLMPIIDIGAEANFLASPYTFEEVDPLTMETSESKFSQNFYGAYVRWYVLPLPAITPYIRGGVAYYSGKWSNDGDVDMKGSVGYNIGAGVDFLMGLYGEVVYHIVSLEPDMENLPAEFAGSKGYNSVQVTVGYSFDLLF